MSHYEEDLYRFQFNVDNSVVLRMYEIDGRKSKPQKIAGNGFEIETALNGLGQEAVVAVTRSKQSRSSTETTRYDDADGDGLFVESFSIEVARGGLGARLEQHQFTFDADGKVLTDLELKRGRWVQDRIDADEQYTLVDTGGTTQYVVVTEQERDGIEFEVFRNDNGDGIWTKVAEGESEGPYIDPASGAVDLVGLMPLLDASAGIIG